VSEFSEFEVPELIGPYVGWETTPLEDALAAAAGMCGHSAMRR
jgi:hypothetical protein